MSYKIDQGAEIIYPSSLTLLGTRCTFEGLVVGVHRLVVAEGADVVFSSTTQTGIQSINHTISKSVSQSVRPSVRRLVSQSVSQSINQSTSQLLASQSCSQSANQSCFPILLT